MAARAYAKSSAANGTTVECDLLVTATGWTAPTSLLNMAGDKPIYKPEAARFFTSELSDDVLATGGIVGDGTLDELLDHARNTGKEAVRRSAKTGAALRASVPQAVDTEVPPGNEPAALPELPVHEHPELFRGRTHGFVDYSEDVSSKDLFAAVKEGYDSSELAKRYTTATMGPTQGKLETVNAVAVIAEATGKTIEETGTTTWRPPYAPITLGALAGRNFEPVCYSPMQPWHERQGAEPLVAGAWIRPDHYGDPHAEVRNVRESVGIIDVTPLGKLDLRGPDVPELLKPALRQQVAEPGGRKSPLRCDVRRGRCDPGRRRDRTPRPRALPDDHHILRRGGRLRVDRGLAPDLPPGLESPRNADDLRLRQHQHSRPRNSRELLSRIAEGVDLSNEAFPYMNVRTGTVAGVEGCFMWRIGFYGRAQLRDPRPGSLRASTSGRR